MKKRSISTIAMSLLSLVALAASMPRATSAQRAVSDGPGVAVAFQAITFQSVLAGVSPDGEGSVWEGRADGALPGRMRLELRQVGPATEAANPVWHVRARWTLDAGRARSFVADLEGAVDWKAGLIRLAGPISSGWMSGAWLEQEGRVVSGDIFGSITIIPGMLGQP
jgi:hypothetical protein